MVRSGRAALRRDRRRQPMADASKANPQGVERLGYLGLGLMGTPMTRRLLKAGYHVSVWNRSEGKVAPLVEAGAKRADTPRDLLANSRHRLHVRDGCRSRRRGDLRAGRPCSGSRRRQARGRFLIDPSRCRARACSAIESCERRKLDRCTGVRRHQGRRRRHACHHGRRRGRRHRAGAALCAGHGAQVHPHGSHRRRPDHKALQPGDRRMRDGRARGSNAPCLECRN